MIARLTGAVVEKNLNDAVIDVNGVGYRVAFSLLSLARLPDTGEKTTVRVRTVVREDAFDLYGFLTANEEDMFLMLTTVSHVGPRLALNVLSGLEVDQLAAAIANSEVGRLTRIHGVGKKTAERLVLELKEKAKLLTLGRGVAASATSAPAKATPARSDLISALNNLGYKPQQSEKAADVAMQNAGADAPFEALFREAMKALRG